MRQILPSSISWLYSITQPIQWNLAFQIKVSCSHPAVKYPLWAPKSGTFIKGITRNNQSSKCWMSSEQASNLVALLCFLPISMLGACHFQQVPSSLQISEICLLELLKCLKSSKNVKFKTSWLSTHIPRITPTYSIHRNAPWQRNNASNRNSSQPQQHFYLLLCINFGPEQWKNKTKALLPSTSLKMVKFYSNAVNLLWLYTQTWISQGNTGHLFSKAQGSDLSCSEFCGTSSLFLELFLKTAGQQRL